MVQAREWLNTMLTNNIAKLDVGQGQYTFLLNERGGIIDDLIAYRVGSKEFLLVVNASRTDENLAWLQEHPRGDVKIDNRSKHFGGVAIQGPRVVDLFPELPPRNHIVDLNIDEMPISIARTGYTGEDGVEVFFRAGDAVKFWRLMLERGAKPCGLGARDTLRLEMCYPLNGSDLSPERNPIEAGLGFFVDLTKPSFIGRSAVETKKRTPTQLVPSRMKEKGPPPRPLRSVREL
jgi:aminomethyltransferase